MIERIWEIWSEAKWVLVEIVGADPALEKSLTNLQAALDDLGAVSTPSDE